MESKRNTTVPKNQRIQYFSDLWSSQRATATVEQKDKVGLAFISEILGLGDDIAEKFVKGNVQAYKVVGMKQSTIPFTTDTSKFWQEIQGIFPDAYGDEDMEFLIADGDVCAVLRLLHQLDHPLTGESLVLGALVRNAHIYK